MVEFTKETPVLVRNFHYDLNEENHVKSEVNIALRKAAQKMMKVTCLKLKVEAILKLQFHLK